MNTWKSGFALKKYASITSSKPSYTCWLFSIACAALLLCPVRAEAARTIEATGLELLPSSAAPAEMLAIEAALLDVSAYTSTFYAWNLAVIDTRLTVLGAAGKKSEVVSADLSAIIEPVVLAPKNGSMRIELYVHYYVDRSDAKRAYQSQADELSFAAGEERGVRDEFIPELRTLDFERDLAKKAPIGAIIDYSRFRYETIPPDWLVDSYILSGSGSILALVTGAKSSAYTLRIDFKAESAPDARALIDAFANSIFTAGFGASPQEYRPFHPAVADSVEQAS